MQPIVSVEYLRAKSRTYCAVLRPQMAVNYWVGSGGFSASTLCNVRHSTYGRAGGAEVACLA